MKQIFLSIAIYMFSVYSVQSQDIMTNNEDQKIKATVEAIFSGTDVRDWQQVEGAFAPEVLLDYTSLAGGEPVKISPQQITDSWKKVLPGFDRTHHQIFDFKIEVKDGVASVHHSGKADHFLSIENEVAVWTVNGTYDFHLRQIANKWVVDQMKFNLTEMTGNMDLPRLAQEKVQAIEQSNLKFSSAVSAENNKQQVRRFFQLLEAEKIDELIELFADNGQQINPYASGLFPTGAQGKAALKAYWEPVPGLFDGMEFPIEVLLATENPNIIFVKYQGKIKLKDSDQYYQNDYYSTFQFDAEGKITEYVEIFNPIVAARGFGLLDKIK